MSHSSVRPSRKNAIFALLLGLSLPIAALGGASVVASPSLNPTPPVISMPTSIPTAATMPTMAQTVENLSRTKHTSAEIAAHVFTLKCYTQAKNDLYMGIEQRLHIQAPVSAVTKVLDQIEEYVDLFPGYKKIELENKTGNRFTIFFEQKVPVLFVPNIKYEMLYEKDDSQPDDVVYRYHLKEPGKIKASDGMIRVLKTAKNETDYIEYDFFDAEWGLGSILGKSKLWSEVVQGFWWSDLALKLKAEKPELKPKEVRDQAEKQVSDDLVDACIQKKTMWISPETL
jgi:carbon monoxide dehydrogenase subunit G